MAPTAVTTVSVTQLLVCTLPAWQTMLGPWGPVTRLSELTRLEKAGRPSDTAKGLGTQCCDP